MRLSFLVVAATALSGPAFAAPAYEIHIPAGTLQKALIRMGSIAGVTIGLTDRRLGLLPVGALDGRFDVAGALRRLLRNSDARVVQTDGETFQIVRRNRRSDTPEYSPGAATPEKGAIVVTGSKRSAALADYPGAVALVNAAAIRPSRALHGSDGLADQLPVLASTHLGPGRDKLFIRGIADSSFAGPTQATVGQYLGEVRLNYNAPDPDLALYDMREIEVLEGPQGTLYGAGSLGGIIRLEPTPPDLANRSLSVSAGGSPTAHGSPGADAAVIANLPLADGRLALRVVAYGGADGGYIDDPSRGRFDINHTTTRGARVILRWQPRADWTIDTGGVVQDINSRDGQYAERGAPPLTRASAIGQPFDNDYGLADIVVRHTMGETILISATSFVTHEVDTVYDASATAHAPERYESNDAISIWTNETRLSHHGSGGRSWVAGFELLRSEDRLTRLLGSPDAPIPISGTRNVVEEVSAYGEVTLPLFRGWSIIGGGRLAYTRQAGQVLSQPAPRNNEPDRQDISALPSLALLWKPVGRLSLYARYQEGYRPGGLSVQANNTQRFDADSLANWELGARYGSPADRFSAAMALSYAHWENIQADLVDGGGLPYTANIGNGRVIGIEFNTAWRPSGGLRLTGALFANESRLTTPAAAYAGEDDATLPNIPDLIGRVAAGYATKLAGRPVDLSASLRYVGHSRLGVGPMLDIRQGGYFDTAIGGSARLDRVTVSLDATNLLDTRGNIFALGNPFGVAAGRQVTPLRPRTVRIGFSVPF